MNEDGGVDKIRVWVEPVKVYDKVWHPPVYSYEVKSVLVDRIYHAAETHEEDVYSTKQVPVTTSSSVWVSTRYGYRNVSVFDHYDYVPDPDNPVKVIDSPEKYSITEVYEFIMHPETAIPIKTDQEYIDDIILSKTLSSMTIEELNELLSRANSYGASANLYDQVNLAKNNALQALQASLNAEVESASKTRLLEMKEIAQRYGFSSTLEKIDLQIAKIETTFYDIWDLQGNKHSGYIYNGTTYLNNDQELSSGWITYVSGKYWEKGAGEINFEPSIYEATNGKYKTSQEQAAGEAALQAIIQNIINEISTLDPSIPLEHDKILSYYSSYASNESVVNAVKAKKYYYKNATNQYFMKDVPQARTLGFDVVSQEEYIKGVLLTNIANLNPEIVSEHDQLYTYYVEYSSDPDVMKSLQAKDYYYVNSSGEQFKKDYPLDISLGYNLSSKFAYDEWFMGTGNPVAIPDPPPTYSTLEKTQYYLDKMKFEIGEIDDSFGVSTSYALLIVESYMDYSNVRGVADDELLERIKALANSGITYSDIKSEYIDTWTPKAPAINVIETKNGSYDISTFTRIPIYDGGDAFAEKEVAISWAMMVHEAKEHNVRVANGTLNDGEETEKLEIWRFGVKGSSGGYRTYHKQVEAEIFQLYCNGPKAANPVWADVAAKDAWITANKHLFSSDNGWNNIPDDVTKPGGALAGYGTSPHGTGVALDMKVGSLQDAAADTIECQWILDNGKNFGFSEWLDSTLEDGTKILNETWHFNYDKYSTD